MGKSGHRVSRPLSFTLHASKPNDAIHFDYLYMGDGIQGYEYILVIKDDLSSYIMLFLVQETTAEVTATHIDNGIRTFTSMKYWISKQAAILRTARLRS